MCLFCWAVNQKSRLHLTAARLSIPRPTEEVGSVPPEWDGVVYQDKRGWFGEWLVGTPLLGDEAIGEYLVSNSSISKQHVTQGMFVRHLFNTQLRERKKVNSYD